MSLGNHEFDEGVDGVTPFIANLSAPVLAANLILHNVPELQEESNLYNSIVLIKEGVKIGIIGYLTPDTKFLAPYNKVDYEEEIIAIRREVEKLEKNGVNIIIALGHSGFLKDIEIAKEVHGLDLVIGGHSNTFLSNDNHTNEMPEVSEGPYPIMIKQASGTLVPVVQAYAYTKYMGSLHLVFNTRGELLKCFGNPILLNQEISEDEELLQRIGKYRDAIDRIYNEVVGESQVFLNGDQCRLKECNLGNVITDAIIDFTKNNYHNFSNIIAIIQGGRIRSSLIHPEIPFKVTRGDLITVLPFSDMLGVITMNGSVLIKVLEHSVESWRTIDSPGQFLQFSGMEVVYDLGKPPGSRVVKAKALCSGCPEMKSIDNNLTYQVILPTFLAEGGDGYTILQDLPINILPYSELTCIIDYFQKYSPINPTVTGRIALLNEDKLKIIPSSRQANNENARDSGITNKLDKYLSAVLLSLVVIHRYCLPL